VEPGTASEEKILVTRTGSTDTTINVASDSVRGQDGTSAVAHSTGSTVFPVFTAVDADEANELTSKWSTKGDLVSYGTSTFEKLGVGTNGQFLRAASAEASGLKWETFNNTLGSGAAVRVPSTFVGGDVLQASEMNALPGGVIDYSIVTSNNALSGTTPVTIDTLTVPTVSGRQYALFTNGAMSDFSVACEARIDIDFNGTRIFIWRGNVDAAVFTTYALSGVFVGDGSTFTIVREASVSSGTADHRGSATFRSTFFVTDLGAI